jgi:type IV pilus assembly protein PilW
MKPQVPHQTGQKRQKGFSLVELMIALVLGLVLSAGVYQVFTNSTQTYQLSDSLSNLQENLRFAVGRLQYETRMAGHKGCLIGEPFNNLDTAADDPVYGRLPVSGWEADGTDIGDAYTNDDFTFANTSLSQVNVGTALPADLTGTVLPGSDVLVVNNATRVNVTLTGNPAANANTIGTDGNSGIPAGKILMAVTSDCTGGDIFQKTNVANSASLIKDSGQSPGNQTPVSDGFNATYDDNASIYEFASTAYYIGRRDADAPPSLYMHRLDAGDPFNAVELVEGVENMQVLYGVTNPGGDVVISYVSADNVNDWANVASVRVGLLLRSDDGVQDGGLEDGEADVGQQYNLLGTRITAETDERARMVGIVTVGIRNRLE